MDGWRCRHPDDTPPEAQPFALTAEATHGPVLLALNKGARAASIRVGQRVTDARAICPALALAPSEPQADARALRDLALWATRWTPFTAIQGANGLFLDLTGTAHLWGGEDRLGAEMLDRLARLGLSARLAIAPTIGAAWALSHYGGERLIIASSDGLEHALAYLPIDSLRLEPDTLVLLRRLGLKRVEDLVAIPQMPLGRRFTSREAARNPLTRLHQATGALAEPVMPEIADPPPRVLRRVTEPIVHLPLLETLLGEMAATLALILEQRSLGLRRLCFDGYRVDGGVQTVAIETAAPVRDPGHMLRLFNGKLDTLDAGFGFDAAALTAARCDPMGAAQTDLLRTGSEDALLARLLDRLVAKLGSARVRRPLPVQSHIPERSVRWVGALEGASVDTLADEMSPRRERPLRLFDRPESIEVVYATPEGAPRQFRWRKRAHRVTKMEGPERIGPEWWRERSTARARDYYRVEDETGRRYWIYRDGRFGDGRDNAPDWFLHGLFA